MLFHLKMACYFLQSFTGSNFDLSIFLNPISVMILEHNLIFLLVTRHINLT